MGQTSVLEVRSTVAATSTNQSLPETVAVGDGGGSSESGSTVSAASSLILSSADGFLLHVPCRLLEIVPAA